MRLTPAQLHTLCTIADDAGRAVMEIYGGELEIWTKDDATPLTEADLRADTVIRQGLQAQFPGMFVLSEESSSAFGEPETFFLVDPLDGTKEFLKRSGEFTINIALIHRGASTAGVVLAPALGEMFFAAHGLGAWSRKGAHTAPLSVAKFVATNPLRVIGSRSHGGNALAAWLANLHLPHSFVAAGSSLKFCRIAEGQADVYPRLGPTSQWDTAAAQCILETAGGNVTALDGTPLRYGLDRPILNPEFIATSSYALLEAIMR